MQVQMKRYSIPGPTLTIGQFRLRQGGTPFNPSPFFCRGRNHGRKRELARALPRASRLAAGNLFPVAFERLHGDHTDHDIQRRRTS